MSLSLLGMLGIGAGLQAASPVLSSVGTGLGNLISGGTWSQNGSDVATQNFNALEAQKGRDFTSIENQLNREFNAQQNQLNRDFEERLSNTAYQRQVEDMRKAGLNPYLAYSQGGAGVPVVQSASYGSAGVSPTASFVNHARYQNNELLNSALKVYAGLTYSTNKLVEESIRANSQAEYRKLLQTKRH